MPTNCYLGTHTCLCAFFFFPPGLTAKKKKKSKQVTYQPPSVWTQSPSSQISCGPGWAD